MARIPLDVATGFYESPSNKLAAQECLNMYPRVVETVGGLSRTALFPTYGINQVATAPVTGDYRGGIIYSVGAGPTPFVVIGQNLYSIDSSYNYTLIGTVSGISDVSMAFNGETIAIQVRNGSGYFYDAVNGLVQITDPIYLSYGNVRDVVTKDGYFIYATADEVFLSDLVTQNGGRGFSDVSFFTAEVKPDFNTRLLVLDNELYVVGTNTIELFQNTGTGESQPFQRIPAATVNNGLFGDQNIIQHLDRFIFIGQSEGQRFSIYRLEGSVPVKISTQPIDEIINDDANFLDVSNGYAFSFQEAGSFFVGFTFGDHTIIYDSTASSLLGRPIWHKRGGESSSWRAKAFINAYGETLVFDDQGTLAELDENFGTEYALNVFRRFAGQYLSNQTAPLFVNEIEVYTDSRPISVNDNEVKLEVSYDGAETWIDFGNISLGSTTDSNLRQIWRRIGRVDYQVIFRITMENTDSTKVLQMTVEAAGGQKWL